MSGANYTHVTLVVDPNFGQRAAAQSKLGPLWVIKSPDNVSPIEEIWASGESPFADAPTYFDNVADRTPEESADMFIGTVDTHHPDWLTFEILGAKLSSRLLASLQECAPGTARETDEGFVFTRHVNSN